MSVIHFLKKHKFSKLLVQKAGKKRAFDLVKLFEEYVKLGDKILDIGTGTGHISSHLANQGFMVTPLDIENISFFESVKPLIYDGDKIPFNNDSYEVSLLITVLHHTDRPETLIKEASRVSNQIIIIEDVYNSSFQKYLTYTLDSLFNLEFINHPRSNKTDKEWREVFKSYGLVLKYVHSAKAYKMINQQVYVLNKI